MVNIEGVFVVSGCRSKPDVDRWTRGDQRRMAAWRRPGIGHRDFQSRASGGATWQASLSLLVLRLTCGTSW